MVELLIETWTWWTAATIVFLTRLVARLAHGSKITLANGHSKYNLWRGIKGLRVEDVLMCLAYCFYTSDIVTMNITAKQQSNLLPPNYLKTHILKPEEISARHFGSVMTMVVEQCQICTVWLVKICVLLMWYHLTTCVLKWRHRIVVFIGVYVVFTFALMETLYFAVWCRPFSAYFAVPTSNPKQCAAAWNHLITNAVCNLSSDLMLLAITVSIAFENNISWRLKMAFASLCGLGVFVIICACLNKAYSWHNPYGSAWTFWYIREASTAILLANLPYVWQFVAGLLNTRKYDQNSGKLVSSPTKHSHYSSRKDTEHELSRLPSSDGDSLNHEKPPPSHRRADITSREILDAEFASFADDLCEQNKRAHRTENQFARDVDRFYFDERVNKLPVADGVDLSEFMDTKAGSQEISAFSSRRGTPMVSHQASNASLPRGGGGPSHWQPPAAWDRSAKDESAHMELSDVGGLAKKP